MTAGSHAGAHPAANLTGTRVMPRDRPSDMIQEYVPAHSMTPLPARTELPSTATKADGL
jgi:hypothetical protein